MNNKYSFKSQVVELSNQQGRSHVFLLRGFKAGDEEGIISCIEDEYGDTYFKRDFYNKDWISKNAVGDRYLFFVAETDGEIVGMTILTLFTDGANYIEPASQILKKEYRGYGLSDKFVDYVFAIAEGLRPNSLFVHAVTFHKITQSLCEARKMIPTGFRLGTFLTKDIVNSYELRDCVKYSEGIMVKAVGKKSAGIIYLPAEISDFGRKIYDCLGASYEIRNSVEIEDYYIRDKSQLTVKYDNLQKNVFVTLEKVGKDLSDEIKKIIDAFDKAEPWTMQVTLSISTPDAFYAYAELKKLGMFFSGLKPLCSEEECMYMQWTGNIKLNMDQYVLTSSFDELRKDIEGFYSSRIMGENNEEGRGQID